MLCSNCDCNRGTFSCADCQSGENIFCIACSQLHVKIKAFKQHAVAKIEEKRPPNCMNCDSDTASFKCGDCPASDSFLCNGCAILHRQIKMFRHHDVIPIDFSQLSASVSSESIRGSELFVDFMRSFRDFRDSAKFVIYKTLGAAFLQPRLATIGVSMFVIMLCLRLIFGRNAAVFFLIICIGGLKIYMDNEKVELKVSE